MVMGGDEAAALASSASANPQSESDMYLPPLREELTLHPGPATRHGSPTWTLFDPAGYRFYRLGWLESEIVSRWKQGSCERVLASVHAETLLRPEIDDIVRLIDFFSKNGLLQTRTEADVKRLMATSQSTKQGAAMWLLKNYLFFRIPLFRPDALLQMMVPWFSWMFTRVFVACVLACGATGLYLIFREWAFFRQSAVDMLTPEGALMAGGALLGIKIVHEFAHGLATRYYGCRVPVMGVAFMVFCPVLWTDTTEAWKLRERHKRLTIGAAGMISELTIAAAASVLWFIIPDGPLRTAIYMLAAVAWITSLAINCNPFMRYDGYYLLSDILEIADLQSRSFALGKWRLREFLFGFNDPRPYMEEQGRENLLIILAYATWIYRFFLFLGIAVLVYLFFFKALGVILMSVELGWFIGRPIVSEVAVWMRKVREKEKSSIPFRTIVLFIIMMCFLVLPWQRRLTAPAMLAASDQIVLFSPREGQVEELLVTNGAMVEKGQVLWRIASPSLEYEKQGVELQLQEMRHRIELGSLDNDLNQYLRANLREIEQLQIRLEGLKKQESELTATAPFTGRLTDMGSWMGQGVWVDRNTAIATAVGGSAEVIVFVQESDLERIEVGAQGLFYEQSGARSPLQLTVRQIDSTHIKSLKYAQLASTRGGPIGVSASGYGELVPDRTLYKLICDVSGEGGAPTQTLPGRAVLECPGRSFVLILWRNLMGLFVRESGF